MFTALVRKGESLEHPICWGGLTEDELENGKIYTFTVIKGEKKHQTKYQCVKVETLKEWWEKVSNIMEA